MYRYDSFWHSSRVYTYVKMSISMVMQQKGKIYGSFCFVRLERHTSSLFLQSNVMFFFLYLKVSLALSMLMVSVYVCVFFVQISTFAFRLWILSRRFFVCETLHVQH